MYRDEMDLQAKSSPQFIVMLRGKRTTMFYREDGHILRWSENPAHAASFSESRATDILESIEATTGREAAMVPLEKLPGLKEKYKNLKIKQTLPARQPNDRRAGCRLCKGHY